MDIIEIGVEELRPNPFNTNRVSPPEMEKLEASLERFGWVRPVIVRQVDAGLEILGGHHRVMAARSLGYITVPCVNLGEISDRQAREIGLVDNARYGSDDGAELAKLIADLGGAETLSEFLPINEDDLEALSVGASDDEIDDLLNDDGPAPEPEKKPAKTHAMMRFKVPVDDADAISDAINEVMSENHLTESDSLTNAGDALVHLVSQWRRGVAA